MLSVSLFCFKYPLLDSLAAVPGALGSSYLGAQPTDVLPLIQSWEYLLLLRINKMKTWEPLLYAFTHAYTYICMYVYEYICVSIYIYIFF